MGELGGDASVAGAGLYSTRLQSVATTMEERGAAGARALGGRAGGARQCPVKVHGCPWCLVYYGAEQEGYIDHFGRDCTSNGRPRDGGYSNRQSVGCNPGLNPSAFGQWLKRHHGDKLEDRMRLLSGLGMPEELRLDRQ